MNFKIHIKLSLGEISLLIALIAFSVGIFEAGPGCFLTIPLYFIGLFGSLLGIIPFVGPVFYYYGIGWLFNEIQSLTNLQMPISTGLLFYSNLIFSCLYCVISSTLLTMVFLFRKQLKLIIEKMRKTKGGGN